ncbi:MAG: hypothetical protein AB1505_36675, partial [Candidatus Latescibacterota bacterium]
IHRRKAIQRPRPHALQTHGLSIAGLAAAADVALLAMISLKDGRLYPPIRVIGSNLQQERAAWRLGGLEAWYTTHIAFRPDGRVLATADTSGGVGLWDLERRVSGWSLPPPQRLLTFAGAGDRVIVAPGASPLRAPAISRWSAPVGTSVRPHKCM